jgi:hypothetical protein
VLAILPYQVHARKSVIAYYVMTRDVTEDLPPEQYTVELAGLDSGRASFRAYDPLADREIPVASERRGETSLRLVLTAVGYPYLLIVEE